jgi:hypothetical protein
MIAAASADRAPAITLNAEQSTIVITKARLTVKGLAGPNSKQTQLAAVPVKLALMRVTARGTASVLSGESTSITDIMHQLISV